MTPISAKDLFARENQRGPRTFSKFKFASRAEPPANYRHAVLPSIPNRILSPQNENVRFEQSRNVRFHGGRRSHGNGAHRLESTRTGPAESVTRGKAETDHTDRSCQAAEDHRSSGASPAAPSAGAGRPGADSRITWTALEPQVGSRVRAEDSGAGAPTLCGLRAHPGRRTLGPGGVAGEPRDAAEVDDQGQLVAPALPAREDYPCVA